MLLKKNTWQKKYAKIALYVLKGNKSEGSVETYTFIVCEARFSKTGRRENFAHNIIVWALLHLYVLSAPLRTVYLSLWSSLA